MTEQPFRPYVRSVLRHSSRAELIRQLIRPLYVCQRWGFMFKRHIVGDKGRKFVGSNTVDDHRKIGRNQCRKKSADAHWVALTDTCTEEVVLGPLKSQLRRITIISTSILKTVSFKTAQGKRENDSFQASWTY
jgi:hypothetical protein